MPKITECVEKQNIKKGVSRGQLLRCVFPFLVVAVLGIAHIHLQFARTDMMVQASHLQSHQRVLLKQLATLEQAAEKIDMNTLKHRATLELNMQEIANPTKEMLAPIPSVIVAKYSRPLDPMELDTQVADVRNAREEKRGLRATLVSLLDGSSAVAAVADAR